MASSTLTYGYDDLGRLSRVTRPFASAGVNKDVTYAYDLHGWTTAITANSFQEELFYAGGPGTPRWNGNISAIRWKDKTSRAIRGYRLGYDGADRLVQAIYGQSSALTTYVGRFSESFGYDSMGNVTGITRSGKTSSGGYGVMDNLTLTYDGNRLAGVSETVADYDFAGSFEYRRANGSQYIYDANGSLVADRSRGIAYITYDANGNPSRIYFTNGSQTRYTYSAAGEKLLVEHYVAAPNVTVPFGAEPDALTQGQVMYAGSTQYLLDGSLVVKDGMTDRYLFDGGYAKAIFVNPTTYTFEFYYYNKDHLGNIREVVDSSGTVKQVTNYYPSGTPYADPAAVMNANMQPYKYNGKELDRMHGLDTYDYGARQYDPVLGRWDRMDPLCEKYYSVSPYVYCHDNPVMHIDPDGRKIVMSQNNSQEYNFQYNNAITYLKEHGCSSLISYLEDIPIEITIQEIGSNKQNSTDIRIGVNIIEWNAKQGLLTDLGHILSPAIRLYHELAHQEHKLRNPDKFLEDSKPNDSVYQSKDDENIINNEETDAARKCGEIPQDAITRESHGGIPFETTSSTSRNIININGDIKMWKYTWGESETF